MLARYRLGLRGKATLGLSALLLLSLFVSSGFSYWQTKQVTERKEIELEQSKLSLFKRDIEAVLREHQNTLLSLRDVPPVQAILRARANGGIDPQNDDSLDAWQQRLSAIFTAFLSNNQQYLQMRLIDSGGDELVRVEAHSDNTVQIVVGADLQNKAESPYVVEALKLQFGQVYFSSVSFNREHGEIQIPHVPVLRLATPIHDAAGDTQALIVINLLTERMFSDVRALDNGIRRYIVDEQGSYIKPTDSSKTFAVEQGGGYNFWQAEPALAALTLSQDKHMRRYASKQEIAGFQKIYFSALDHSRYWLLILHVPESVVFADITATRNNMLFAGLSIGLLSLLLILWFVSRRIVDPVLHLAIAAARLRDDDLSVRLDESVVHDEFRSLYKMFNIFTQRQQEATGQLRREIDAQTRRLSAVIENVVDGIITIDERGAIASFNQAARRIFGYSEAEVIGQNVKILMPEPYHSEHDGYLGHYINTGERKIIGIGREVVGCHKDGSIFPMELAVSEVNIDSVRHFIGIARDITERKRIERMQKEFISTVSHELRTPLTSISGSLGLILGGVTGELPEKAKALLTIANNNSERLIHLINDILDIEKISAGKIQFNYKVMNLIPVVQQAVDANKGYGDQLNVTFCFSCSSGEPLMVRIDEQRMAQVMSNLLSNAAKYSPPNDKVTISVVSDHDQVRISVQDNGKGIPEEFKAKIFNKFSQADSSDTRQKGGTGLGLNISQAIIEQHKGEIGFESDAGKGTMFYVDLPLCRMPLKNETVSDVDDLEKPLVLVVEDDADVSTLLRMMLENEGYQIHQAYDYPQAMQQLATHSYDAITLDLVIPGGSGITLLRELRRNETTARLPVIVVSARVDAGRTEVEAESLEMVDWLEKPINSDRLIGTIRSALSTSIEGKWRILHVEDDEDIASIVHSLLGDSYQLIQAATFNEAKQLIGTHTFDLVLLDIGLPDGSGLDLLPMLQSSERQIPVVIFSAQDVPEEIAAKVMATLVKSKTNNAKLIQQIKLAINNRTSSIEAPHLANTHEV